MAEDTVAICSDHVIANDVPQCACEVCALREMRRELSARLDAIQSALSQNTSDEEKRLRLMADGDSKWDLSYNDRCAISWVLDALKYRTHLLAEANIKLTRNPKRRKIATTIGSAQRGGIDD